MAFIILPKWRGSDRHDGKPNARTEPDAVISAKKRFKHNQRKQRASKGQ